VNQPATHPDSKPARPKRYWLWPGIIVGMLLTHTLVMLIFVMVATGDPSHAVIPDYHEKAIAWDDHQAQLAHNEKLGWACEITTDATADILGQRTLTATLTDANGQPITDAKVRLQSYHHARANQVLDEPLEQDKPGVYSALLKMRRDGLWAFELIAVRDDDTFVYQADQQVGPRPYVMPSPGASP